MTTSTTDAQEVAGRVPSEAEWEEIRRAAIDFLDTGSPQPTGYGPDDPERQVEDAMKALHRLRAAIAATGKNP